MAELRKRAIATDIDFPLIVFGGTDFLSSPPTFAAADTKITKDGGAQANTTNLPTHIGGGIYTLALTAAEVTADRVVVSLVDSATKLWEDQAILIYTKHLADINAEVLDVIATDTISELAQAVPPANPSLVQGVMYMYMALRNKLTTTASAMKITNDAGVSITSSGLSDDGSTFTRDEAVAGP